MCIIILCIFILMIFIFKWYVDNSISKNNVMFKSDISKLIIDVLKKHDPVYLLLGDKQSDKTEKKPIEEREETIKDII